MTRRLLTALLCLVVGCMSRSNVGAIPQEVPLDSGPSSSADDGGSRDAGVALSPNELAERDFERELVGDWQGVLVGMFWKLEVTFRADNTYCVGIGPCEDRGRYFITDRLSNGHFAGVLLDLGGKPSSYMDDMHIDHEVDRDVLRFARYDDSGVLDGSAELTRAR